MKNYIKFGLLLFFCFQLHQFYAVELVQQDFNTFSNFANKLGINITKYNSSNICYTNGLFCFPFSSQYWIINFDWTGNNTYSIQHEDIQFPYMQRLRFEKMVLQDTFFGQLITKLPNVTEFACNSCNLISIPTGTSKVITLSLNSNDFNGIQKFSSIPQTVRYFSSYNSSAHESLVWVNDLKVAKVFESLSLSTNAFPDCSNLNVTELKLYLTNNFETSLANTKNGLSKTTKYVYLEGKYNQVQNLTFPNNFTTSQTFSKGDTYGLTTYWSLESVYVNWKVATPLVFNTPNSLRNIKIRFGSFSTNDGKFPIQSSSLLDTLEVSYSNNLVELDFNVLRKIRSNLFGSNKISMELPAEIKWENDDQIAWSINPNTNSIRSNYALDLRTNSFYGTLPKWTCNTYSIFSSNKFTGELPSCYTCFLKDSFTRSKISGNNFTNYQDSWTADKYPPCTTIQINQVYIQQGAYQSSRYLQLIGKDLGVHSTIVGMISNFNVSFTPLIENEWYQALVNETVYSLLTRSSTIQVYFPIPDKLITTRGNFKELVSYNTTISQTTFNVKSNGGGSTSTSTSGTSSSGSVSPTDEPNSCSSLFISQTLLLISLVLSLLI
ncbi:hypothetical protein CYY_010412 [Polysphondylium violaceum]|uniref:Uncharacterized protein n=1 Tax=Polysphondylium violaceum TaxID=133409 RepID=A0A8J4PJ73_9MYCE|nr:hypothetical protein CYY_010412 [Polysphondylium violaceum]